MLDGRGGKMQVWKEQEGDAPSPLVCSHSPVLEDLIQRPGVRVIPNTPTGHSKASFFKRLMESQVALVI